jgi:hypothetical protein
MWTYTPALISSSGTTASLMKVRFMVGDTDTTRQQVADEEVYGVLTYETSPVWAAAVVCDALAAKYSFQMNTQNGALQISAEKRMSHYMKLADRLRHSGPGDLPGDPNLTLATISPTAESQAAKDAITSDSDVVQQPFSIGQDDNPFTTTSSSGIF